ncbi:hypothetical protein [Sphingopyxis sp. FD7]|nr:hypothetical protein [Sphingopyxis sp. FD7]
MRRWRFSIVNRLAVWGVRDVEFDIALNYRLLFCPVPLALLRAALSINL